MLNKNVNVMQITIRTTFEYSLLSIITNNDHYLQECDKGLPVTTILLINCVHPFSPRNLNKSRKKHGFGKQITSF